MDNITFTEQKKSEVSIFYRGNIVQSSTSLVLITDGKPNSDEFAGVIIRSTIPAEYCTYDDTLIKAMFKQAHGFATIKTTDISKL